MAVYSCGAALRLPGAFHGHFEQPVLQWETLDRWSAIANSVSFFLMCVVCVWPSNTGPFRVSL